ncbi:unnamed protein product [Rotaria socialis]|uniref:Uncharacterized protein n=1 Tax=Rotaria socialis TaxID=392032 RepID=A0A820VAP4_9BILA|nr:unnamed protein product [Rotaria socialis]
MDNFSGGSTDIYDFLRIALDQRFSLPLMDFALSIDANLPLNLPDRLDHLVKIVKQAFEVDIEPHRMFDMLSMLKQPSADGKNLLQHNKNVEHELNKYVSNIDNLCDFPHSTAFCLTFTLEPKSDRYPQCQKSLSSSSKFRTVTLYLADGRSKKATVVSYECKSNQCSLEIFPNFIRNLSDNEQYCFTNQEFLSSGKYVYLGGQTAFECLLLKQYACLLSNGHVAFDSFTRAFNELIDDSHIPLERRLFERIFIIYEIIQFQLFMGTGEKFLNQCCAFFPSNISTDIDNFIMVNYDRFYKKFVQFWSSHNTFYPCKSVKEVDNEYDLCSAAVICDGHMKIRRRLCANPNIALSLPEHFVYLFKPLIVGCSHTPNPKEKLCTQCKNNNLAKEASTSCFASEKKQSQKQSRSLWKIIMAMIWQESSATDHRYIDHTDTDVTGTPMTTVSPVTDALIPSASLLSCNVHKEDVMTDESKRACGILLLATNCQVIICFEEILRSESRKQVMQALTDLYTITPMLTRIVIYDAGCLLAKSVRANFADESRSNEFNNNIGFKALKEVRFFVDRFHLSNHKDKYCHTHLNLDLDDTLKNINSSSCEQINSWIKSYSQMLSNMNEYRFVAALLILFHLRNCSHTKLCNRWVDIERNSGSRAIPHSSSNHMVYDEQMNII